MVEEHGTGRNYRRLDSEQIVATAGKLSLRVSERFPESGLSHVCRDLLRVAEQAAVTSQWIAKPNLWLKIGVILCIAVLVAIGLGAFVGTNVQLRFHSLSELLQGIEAAINDVIFLGLATLFLVTWETRIKRKRALKAMHELRSLAHIIDMHQLTKDPERLKYPGGNTLSSPDRSMNVFDLIRYLDYCSEMLAIISKIAAVYVQDFDDDVTLSAVNELENLTSGLSRKIWQKIMILDRVLPGTENQ